MLHSGVLRHVIVLTRRPCANRHLHDHWTRTSPEDAEHFPESLVRNFCGNCFHPDLIASALGKNDILKKWVALPADGPTDLVADQSGAFEVFAELCDQVQKEAKNKLLKDVINIDRTLPPFQSPDQVNTAVKTGARVGDQLAIQRSSQCPNLHSVETLQNAFKNAKKNPICVP